MLNVLERTERALPTLLADADGWSSLKIDYHPPFVDRLWRDDGEGHRICLHRIHPCEPGDPLFHPHPWPSAMVILEGRYEMAIGYGAGEEAPPYAGRLIAVAGLRYEMTDRDAWHFVRPIDAPVLTVMVTGAPWERSAPPVTKRLGPLADDAAAELLERFRVHYPD